MNETDELEVELFVNAPRSLAFTRFTEELARWWPQEYTWSQEKLAWIGIDPEVGGRCTERSKDNFTVDFGLVLSIRKPEQLSLAWCIDPERVPVPDPAKASVVDIEFKSIDAKSTMLKLKHSKFNRHGDKGKVYRDNMASDYGWKYILKRYGDTFAN